MGRCPWHGGECDCDGATDPHAGRFAKWMPIDGKCPPWCEERMLVYMVGKHIWPKRHDVSDAKMAEYRAWIADGQPRLFPDEPESDEPDYQQGG